MKKTKPSNDEKEIKMVFATESLHTKEELCAMLREEYLKLVLEKQADA